MEHNPHDRLSHLPGDVLHRICRALPLSDVLSLRATSALMRRCVAHCQWDQPITVRVCKSHPALAAFAPGSLSRVRFLAPSNSPPPQWHRRRDADCHGDCPFCPCSCAPALPTDAPAALRPAAAPTGASPDGRIVGSWAACSSTCLLASPHLASLTHVDLDWGDCPIGLAAWQKLSAVIAPLLPSVTRLRLHASAAHTSNRGDSGVLGGLRHLTHLTVGVDQWQHKLAGMLEEAAALPQLKALQVEDDGDAARRRGDPVDLGHALATAAAAAAAAKSPAVKMAAGATCGGEGAPVVCHPFECLEKLVSDKVPLSFSEGRTLWLPRLRSLSLHLCYLFDFDLGVLRCTPALTELHLLDVCNITWDDRHSQRENLQEGHQGGPGGRDGEFSGREGEQRGQDGGVGGLPASLRRVHFVTFCDAVVPLALPRMEELRAEVGSMVEFEGELREAVELVSLSVSAVGTVQAGRGLRLEDVGYLKRLQEVDVSLSVLEGSEGGEEGGRVALAPGLSHVRRVAVRWPKPISSREYEGWWPSSWPVLDVSGLEGTVDLQLFDVDIPEIARQFPHLSCLDSLTIELSKGLEEEA